ncbi:MAG: multiheme c-type cytochrome [Chloroflexota bacterium]
MSRPWRTRRPNQPPTTATPAPNEPTEPTTAPLPADLAATPVTIPATPAATPAATAATPAPLPADPARTPASATPTPVAAAPLPADGATPPTPTTPVAAATTTDTPPRPRRRRRRILLVAAALVGVVVLALGATVGVVAFQQLYATYGAHPEQNAQEWAARAPHYTLQSGSCRACHLTETLRVRTSWHQNLDCETCHGPQNAHAQAATLTAQGAVAVEKPRRDICSTCHQQIAGRPDTFPQVDKSVHFKGASCAQCHGVHQIIAARPPDITHPRSHLPDCIVCHAPEGIKGLPDGHQASPDAVCLTCHKPGKQLDIAGMNG